MNWPQREVCRDYICGKIIVRAWVCGASTPRIWIAFAFPSKKSSLQKIFGFVFLNLPPRARSARRAAESVVFFVGSQRKPLRIESCLQTCDSIQPRSNPFYQSLTFARPPPAGGFFRGGAVRPPARPPPPRRTLLHSHLFRGGFEN